MPPLSEADTEVTQTYVENRDDMTDRGLRELAIDIWDELEEREMSEIVDESAQ